MCKNWSRQLQGEVKVKMWMGKSVCRTGLGTTKNNYSVIPMSLPFWHCQAWNLWPNHILTSVKSCTPDWKVCMLLGKCAICADWEKIGLLQLQTWTRNDIIAKDKLKYCKLSGANCMKMHCNNHFNHSRYWIFFLMNCATLTWEEWNQKPNQWDGCYKIRF